MTDRTTSRNVLAEDSNYIGEFQFRRLQERIIRSIDSHCEKCFPDYGKINANGELSLIWYGGQR